MEGCDGVTSMVEMNLSGIVEVMDEFVQLKARTILKRPVVAKKHPESAQKRLNY
jgi:hypothetical protein